MTPSQEKAAMLGVTLVRWERADLDARGRRLTFYRFELFGGRVRQTMSIAWHTKAGAWEAALRWAKKLGRGQLQ